MSLVSVLRLRLPNGGAAAPLSTPESQVAAKYDGTEPLALPAVTATPPAAPAPKAPQVAVAPDVGEPKPAAKPATPAPKPAVKSATKPAVTATGKFVVQAGAFSSKDRADRVASAIGGEVSKSGSLYRVRTGPFASRKDAEGSLAKVKAAGYSDARIY